MLILKRLELKGFGPFAEPQVVEFPSKPGVTVIYGDNMRGKTSLLNAIRYAFFGTVLGRGARARRLHTISNRDLATQGIHGFSVSLTFLYEGDSYDLVRECIPRTARPDNDSDYEQTAMLRRGPSVLGPQERDRALRHIFPGEISRFFLFDGELLDEYEELLINESEAGPRISEAIERILGVPILKRGRIHLTRMADEADKQAAREAQKRQETHAVGTALQQATEQKEAHQKELERLHAQMRDLAEERTEAEQFLQSMQKYAGMLQEHDEAEATLEQTIKGEQACRGELKAAMEHAWRSLLRDPVRSARTAAQVEAQKEVESYAMSLRATAIDKGHCSVCDQEVPLDVRRRLKGTIDNIGGEEGRNVPAFASAMARWADLNRFVESDNAGEVRQLFKRLSGLQLEQVSLKDRIADLKTALSDANPDSLRRSKTSFFDLTEKIAAVKKAIEEQSKRIVEMDQNIQRLKKRLESAGASDLRVSQLRAKMLRDSAEVFDAAVERYKTELRSRVEKTASNLFLSMTTEKEDYAGLTINDSYGLTIKHRDGRAEEARSAGAEHVVALALMGALQQNAALRGPIVMDSLFGRLDEKHTSNVIRALPQMAQQVILFAHEKEVGKSHMRQLLASRLLREYELERVTSRRTNIQQVK